ncbi:hypothetical protein Tco_0177818 [Tanacetum coccineum]
MQPSLPTIVITADGYAYPVFAWILERIGTPTLVCMWSCPNFSAPAGRPFRCVSDIWLLISGDAKMCQIKGMCLVLEEKRCNPRRLVYDLVSCAMNDIVTSSHLVFPPLTGCDRLVSEPRMSTPVFVDPESSTQVDGAQSSRVPVPLPEVPYEAIRQTYLDGTDTESEPFEDPIDTETPELPLVIAPPISLFKSTPPLLIPILRRTARMAVRFPHAMSSGLSASMAEVEAMYESVFRKRFRSSYESSPSVSPPNLPSRKRYHGMFELVEDNEEDGDEEDEEIEESMDSDSMSEDAEDEGPTTKVEDPAAEDEGLTAGVKGLDMDDEGYGLDDESHGIDDKGHSVESDGLGLEEEEEAVSAARSSGCRDDSPPVQTPPSPKWTSGLLPISPSPSDDPSPISSPMIPLTIRSLVATPAAVETEGFLTKLGAQGHRRVSLGQGRLGRIFSPRGQTDAQRAALWHAISGVQGENQDLWLQLADERRARLELAEIVDGMRRGQEPKGVTSLRAQFCPCVSALRLVAHGRANTYTFLRKVLDRGWSQKVLERVIVISLET